MTKPFSKEVTDVLATAYALISNDVDHGAVGLIKALLATIAELQAPQKEDVYDKARRLGLLIRDPEYKLGLGPEKPTLPRCAAPEAVEIAARSVRDALPHTLGYDALWEYAETMARYIEAGGRPNFAVPNYVRKVIDEIDRSPRESAQYTWLEHRAGILASYVRSLQ